MESSKFTVNIGVPGTLILGDDEKTINIAEPWFWRQGYALDENPYFTLDGWTVSDFERVGIKFPVVEDQARSIVLPGTDKTLFDFCATYRECDWHGIHYDYNRKYYREFIKSQTPFLIVIPFGSPCSRRNISNLFLPVDLIQAIKQKLCKIIFSCCTEPYPTTEDFWWFEHFMKRFTLTKSDFIIFTANVCFVHDAREQGYEVYEDSVFESDPWFPTKKLPLNIKPDKTFVCLSRRFTPERLAMSSWLYNHYRDKSYISLGDNSSPEYPNRCVGGLSLEAIEEIAEYGIFSSVERNSTGIFRVLDDPDVKQSQNHAGDVSKYLFKGAVNVVLETRPWESNKLFLSEKIWKPICIRRPFVVFGNRGTLRKLHEAGYKTFDKWWDESYDTIGDPNERLQACWRTLDQIGQKDFEEIKGMLQEMTEILQYNRDLYLKNLAATVHTDIMKRILGNLQLGYENRSLFIRTTKIL